MSSKALLRPQFIHYSFLPFHPLEYFSRARHGNIDSKMSGLSGLRSPEDQRISENTALKEWMGENGVWVFDKSDWGVAPHSLSVAVSSGKGWGGRGVGGGMDDCNKIP